MTTSMDYATQETAETICDFSYPYEDDSQAFDRQPDSRPSNALNVPAATRKVWHEFLTQHDVAAAILSVMLPGAAPHRHAFLIGFDAIRHDLGATQQLLAFAARTWAGMGEQATLQFECSTDRAPASESLQPAPVERFLADFEHAVAAQRRHNGAIVRAVYLRKSGLKRFDAQEIASLQLILPLLADSAARGAQLAQQSQRSEMLEAMFDRVSLSMMMLSADSRPLFMNSAASAMIEERNWFIRSADGSIACSNPKQAKQLRESVRLAASAEVGRPVEAVYRLDCGNGEWRLAYVLSAMSKSGDEGTRCALLFVLAPGKMDAPTQLLEALGLLPSEQRFLGHFLKSSSLYDAALDCGLSEETARTYLKRVRAKLGVHRQMELAGLISGLVLPLHGGNSATLGD
jgi:hypothetical protein